MCKACLACGGTPPVATVFDKCAANVATSLDVNGKIEFAFSSWKVGEHVTIQLPNGMRVSPSRAEGFDASQRIPKPAAAASDGVGQRLEIVLRPPQLGNSLGKLIYDYAGDAKTYVPAAVSCLGEPPSPPPKSPAPMLPPPSRLVSPPLPFPPPQQRVDKRDREPPPSPFPPPLPPAPSPSKCLGPDDRLNVAPMAFPMSSASWELVLSSDYRPCPGPFQRAQWEVLVKRGDTEEHEVLSEEAVHMNATRIGLTIFGVRCPKQTYPSGCTFALRMRWATTDGVLDSAAAWSPKSSPRNSRQSPGISVGVGRFEVRFASVTAVDGQWSGSRAQHFQAEAAKQMAVSERSITIVERYAGGVFLVFDLVPAELGLTHMQDRLLGALRAPANHLGVAEMRKVFSDGRTQVLFIASESHASESARGSLMDAMKVRAWWLMLAVGACFCFACTVGRRGETSSTHGAREPRAQMRHSRLKQVDDDDDEMGDDSSTEGDVHMKVHFSEECGEEMDVILPLEGLHSVLELRSAVWDRGSTLIGGVLPPEHALRLSFVDRRGAERPLSVSTPWQTVYNARRIHVTCSRMESDESYAPHDQRNAHQADEQPSLQLMPAKAERGGSSAASDSITGTNSKSLEALHAPDVHIGASGSAATVGTPITTPNAGFEATVASAGANTAVGDGTADGVEGFPALACEGDEDVDLRPKATTEQLISWSLD